MKYDGYEMEKYKGSQVNRRDNKEIKRNSSEYEEQYTVGEIKE